MKECRKYIRQLLTVLVCLFLFSSSVFADTGKAAEIKKQEESILNYELGVLKQEILLSGKVLEDPLSGGYQWFAFTEGRLGIADGAAEYLETLKSSIEQLYQEPETFTRNYRKTDWYRMILVIGALGGDPTSFGTDENGEPIDLVADSTWNSRFDEDDAMLNSLIWELLALDSCDYELPAENGLKREALTEALYGWQNEDGGFTLMKGNGSDVDLTAMALTALAPYGENENTKRAFAYLEELQTDDGSMPTTDFNTGELSSNCESTCWTLIALCSWDKDPETEFIKNGNTLVDGLSSFIGENGDCYHVLEEQSPNAMASYQALYALEAYRRALSGEAHLFALSDAKPAEKQGSAGAGRSNTKLLLSIGIAAAALILIGIVIAAGKKKPAADNNKKTEKKKDGRDGWDEEW